MKALRINGHRIPCQVCRKNYAVIQWKGTWSVCTTCNRAFFIGYMTASMNLGTIDAIREQKKGGDE